MKRTILMGTVILCLTWWSDVPAAADGEGSLGRTNVVLILADDLGWTDLGCYGSDFYETPRLDRTRQHRDEVHSELFCLHGLLSHACGAD